MRKKKTSKTYYPLGTISLMYRRKFDSSPRSQFFTIRTDPKPVNNLFIFFQANEKNSRKKKLTQASEIGKSGPR